MKTAPTQRFSNRVDNYVKYRPSYPQAVIDLLAEKCGLNQRSVIADIGSGTGIFTKLLLESGYQVIAVEPNEPMRKHAETDLKSYQNFTSVDGSAADTTLSAYSADLITCAQAFHWFCNSETQKEFKRILKPGGNVALIWNNRQTDADAFATAYELLLKQKTPEYTEVNHKNLTDADFANFYKNGQFTVHRFRNVQVFDFDGLKGRAFSSSYVPPEDTEEGHQFLNDLQVIFDQYAVKGKVNFTYQTEVYLGKL